MSATVTLSAGWSLAWIRVSPSIPTASSMTFLAPALAQSAYSDAFIGREALTMSGKLLPTPEQNNLMPAPVPVDSTIALLPGLARWNASEIAVVKG